MSEIRKIVILGASFGGIGTAHYLCKHVLPKLQQNQNAKYELHLVDSSTHFWWNVGAPRELVSVQQMKHETYFVPIADGFNQYSSLKDSIIFHHGTANAVDGQARTVSIARHEGGEEILNYYALVIATGVKSPTPLTTLHGDHHISLRALEDMNKQLASASEIIIGGGGPVGVEIAGEIASHLAGKGKVTLITSSSQLVPVFNQSRALKVQKLLQNLGVTIKYNTRISGSKESAGGKTDVQLSDGSTLTCDIYIPAAGVKPNAEFVPAAWKESSGFVKTNPSTLRVDEAGPRVYAAGDIAGVNNGGIVNMFSTLPVVHSNIAHDLLADAKVGSFAERTYTYKFAETQLVPVGPKTGVAAFNGWGLPGFLVSIIKGKDYMAGEISGFTEGTKFKKP